MNSNKIKIPLLFFLLILLGVSCSLEKPPVDEQVNAETFRQKMEEKDGEVVLDVRTPEEFAEGHLPNAININYNGADFESKIQQLDSTKLYMIYCHSGNRSGKAREYMQNNGFDRIIELKTGIQGWREAGLPLEGDSTKVSALNMDSYTKLTGSANLVLVDFYADWCVPCKKMEPMLLELEKEHNERLKLVRIDVEANRNLSQQLEIAAIPVLKVYENGKEKAVFKGLTSKEEILAVL